MFVQLSSLLITFTAYLYYLFSHPAGDASTHTRSLTLIHSIPEGESVVFRPLPQWSLAEISNDFWLGKQRKRSRYRDAGRDGKTAVVEELEMCWLRKTFYLLNIPVFLFHHMGRPHSNPALTHKESGVCAYIFIQPQDIVVMLVKSKPRPVKYNPFSLIENCENPCKGLPTVCATQSHQWEQLIRKCKVGHL